MSRSRTTTRVCALIAVPLLAMAAACGGGGAEQTLIRTYFNATNVGDRGSLVNITMFAWNVREQGTVTGPSVTNVAEERSRPLRLKELIQAEADARAAEAEFAQEKIAYQDANFDAINRVLEAERGGTVASRDSDVQAAWTDWRDRTMEHAKAVSDAQQAVATERSTAELSVYNDRAPVDLSQFDGQIVSKDVDVTATVTLNDNATEQQLVVTLQRTVLENGEEPIEGRWVIANVTGS
ncbi:MAG: hypothetical protein O3A25_11775 [Acidobacteria bacterium]|nr:hypothetical protein [Acidobacteriota bacterium]